MIKQSDWEIWLANPVTEKFLGVVREIGQGARDAWIKEAWDDELWRTGKASDFRAVCRGRAECAEDIADPETMKRYIVEEEDEPERDSTD